MMAIDLTREELLAINQTQAAQITKLLRACIDAREDCLLPTSIRALQLEEAIRTVEPNWVPIARPKREPWPPKGRVR